jgi:Dicarboxylate transport
MTRNLLRNTAARVALAITALVLVAAGVVWSERVALVRWVALRAVDGAGLGPASLVIDDVSLGNVRAHSVSLRGGALRVETVSAAFNPLALIARRIEQVDIAGLDLALELGPDGFRVGSKPLGGPGGGALPAWRIDDAALANMHVAVATNNGDVKATLSVHLALGGGVVSARDLASEIMIPLAGAARALHLTARGLTAAPGAPGLPLLSLTQAEATLQGLPWRATGIDATVSSSTERIAAVASVAELANLQQPALVVPLRLSAEANLAGGKVETTLTAATIARSPFSLAATGRYEMASANGSLVLTIEPLTFKPREFQPRDLMPALPPLVENVAGAIGLAGSIAWHGQALAPNLLLRLDNLGFTADGAQIRALSGAIRLTKLWPPATAPHQALSATIEASPGLPAAKLSFHGQLTAKPALVVDALAAAIAGGEIATAPLTIDPAALALDTTLHVAHLDLAEVTKLLAIDGLGGTGALDGDIPLAFANHRLTVRDGKLAAKGAGVLRYQPQHLPPQVAAAGESVDLALKALSDFHYDRLSLELDKSADGEGTVLLHIEGKNPAVMSGQPFNFNIRVESNFDRLADYALLSLRSAQDLLRDAAGRSTP